MSRTLPSDDWILVDRVDVPDGDNRRAQLRLEDRHRALLADPAIETRVDLACNPGDGSSSLTLWQRPRPPTARRVPRRLP